MGPKAAAIFAAWTLGLALLGARGATRGSGGRGLERLEPLPDFRMTAVTAKGEAPLGRDDLLGRPWVASFIYTRCAGPCPLITAEMAHLQAALPEGIRLVTFTVDPEQDDPETLRRYARRFGAKGDRWVFLRGEKGPLYKLMYEGFRLPLVEDPGAPEGYRVTHSTRFVLVDAKGVVRGTYDRPDGLKALRRDAAALLKETSS